MSKVFVSFLGMGNYQQACYTFNDKNLSPTKFVQAAIIENYGKDFFDEIHIITTESSQKKHFNDLKKELTDEKGVKKEVIKNHIISQQLSEENHQDWFMQINSCVSRDDYVWFDMTHGYRAFSIILSSSLGYLQKAKKINLKAVHYGAHDAPGCPIIDMREFYTINEWADAVSRIEDSADTGKMAELAQKGDMELFSGLNDKEIISSLKHLTDNLKNVDINKTAEKTETAVTKIKEKIKTSGKIEKELLNLVIDKFSNLLAGVPPSGKYDKNYFRLQLMVIEMLIKHKLLMQAFTVMREMIGSVGMTGVKEKYTRNMANSKGRDGRKYADIFTNMIQFENDKWDFRGNDEKMKDKMVQYYNTLEDYGITGILTSFVPEMVKIRNGFDHAWTSQGNEDRKLLENAEEKAEEYKGKLGEVVGIMENKGLI